MLRFRHLVEYYTPIMSLKISAGALHHDRFLHTIILVYMIILLVRRYREYNYLVGEGFNLLALLQIYRAGALKYFVVQASQETSRDR